ncbi:hypothetical protein J1614_001877 [Plenodomus biglobosus]|nr:hypothetical protein J1614_001877 [Plenodomus biglobosus]
MHHSCALSPFTLAAVLLTPKSSKSSRLESTAPCAATDQDTHRIRTSPSSYRLTLPQRTRRTCPAHVTRIALLALQTANLDV